MNNDSHALEAEELQRKAALWDKLVAKAAEPHMRSSLLGDWVLAFIDGKVKD